MASKRDLYDIELTVTNLLYCIDFELAASAVLSYPLEEINEHNPS